MGLRLLFQRVGQMETGLSDVSQGGSLTTVGQALAVATTSLLATLAGVALVCYLDDTLKGEVHSLPSAL